MERNAEALPILEKQLSEFNQRADALLMVAKYTPKREAPKKPAGEFAYVDTQIFDEKKEASVLKAAVKKFSSSVLPDNVNRAINAVKQGLRIGFHLSALYTQSSGLQILIDRNKRAPMQPAENVELRDKTTTASAIVIFAAAYYVSWDLSRDSSIESRAEIDVVPEINLQNTADAMNCMMYYYGTMLDRDDLIQTTDDFVQVTRLYFRAVVEAVKSRADALKYAEPFTSRSYKLEKSEFSVSSFTAETGAAVVSVEFNRVELGEIVGNHVAKRNVKLMVQRLLSYDFETRRNPFMEMGGLQTLRMGFGPPGTGKSMLIAATATALSDGCKMLKYPFAFRPLPDNIISTFQGGSAERALEWFRPFSDPTKIQYGTIDDGETNLEDRTRQNVSAGVREFIGVTLRQTEGAYAINHGQHTIDIFTNIPDQIDKAVLSRTVVRYLIPGAETSTDFIDQDYLWWRRYQKIDIDFVDMDNEEGHVYLRTQQLLRSLSDAGARHNEPSDERIKLVFDRARKVRSPKNHGFFGLLFAEIRKDFPFFTSRDVRNIQKAVDNRVLDFELPDEWLVHPDQYYFKPYDEKKAILVDMMKQNMEGLSFAEIRLQEAVAYLDEMVRIADVTRTRRLDDLADQIVMQMQARARVEKMEKEGKIVLVT